jgi:hypothetical protein
MPIDLIFDNFWVWLILASVFNAFYLKVRSRKFIEKQPELQAGYDQLFKGELIYLNVPWVVAGIGIVFGGVPSFFSYLTPREGNLFVLAFHVTIIVLWILTIWWIYFRGGAEFLVKHPGVFRQDIKSPTLMKILFGVLLAGGIVAMINMWTL